MYVKPIDYDKIIRENQQIIGIEAKIVEQNKEFEDKLKELDNKH